MDLVLEEILDLAKNKFLFKNPNISMSIDPARFKEKFEITVGYNGVYFHSKGESFSEAANVLLEHLKSSKWKLN